MIKLSLDLAQHVGYAVFDDNKYITSGHAELKKNKGKLSSHLYFYSEYLPNLVSQFKPDLILYEDVCRHVSTKSAHAYGAYKIMLLCFCEQNNIKTAGVGVTHIKKVFCGKGNAKKEDVIKKANQLGFAVTDDNEADAIAIQFTFNSTKM